MDGLPSDYKISEQVFIDLIKSDAKGLQFDLANRIDTHGVKILEWYANGIDSYLNFIYGTFVNAYQATNSFVHDFIWSEATTYSWNYYFTGANPNYPGSGDYGTAYGFRFIGAGGEKFDFVLDANGDYYGHSLIGNWTPSEDPAPTNWILINQGLDNFYTPSISVGRFSDLKSPFIDGKSLHFFYYRNDTEHEVILNDFTNLNISYYPTYLGSSFYIFEFYSTNPNNFDLNSLRMTDNGNNVTLYGSSNHSLNLWRTTNNNIVTSGFTLSSIGNPSFNLPGYYINQPYQTPTQKNNNLGRYNGNMVSGFGDIYLGSFSYSPNPDPQVFPETPVPISSIPEDPEDPIPQSNPEPVPGIEYPVNPNPIPLPPFATIVSGNDDLWGVTLDFEGAQDGLLPYMNSLSEFQFPSFSDLISDFSGSIIWVAQLMSILYNGTPLNVLFIALCLFSLVSVLIGAYKLWNSTEPDPGNPGMRRYKRPPKGGKKH